MSFGDSRPVSQACLTAISGPGVYLRQSLAHESLEFENQKVYVIYARKLSSNPGKSMFLPTLGLLDDNGGCMNLTAQELTMV